MSEPPLTPEDGPEPSDLGEPVAELQDLGWTASDRFGRKVTGGIERRLLASRLLDVTWSGPLLVLLELLRVPFESFSTGRRDREKRP